MNEKPITFECDGAPLVGVLHRTARPSKRGVLMVVAGGPQYRAGGHRQLVLWARRLAAEGYPVLRFDQRGWGDSYGNFHDYDAISDDIRAAIDFFMLEEASLEEIVLWGECNAASAILFYAYRDSRVRGLALQNPWARSEQGEARTILRHYYLMRLKQPEFWQKLLRFRFNPFESLRSLLKLVARSRSADESTTLSKQHDSSSQQTLPERLFAGFRLFTGPIMLVLSSQDIIAQEFNEAVRANPAWSALLTSISCQRIEMADGDHTFSSAQQRNKVISWAIAWMGSW